ncbi:MAG: hypothetical protein PWQ79_99 [Thermococcaceae archaeon]|nr:hypothetical protein [Thermococcaceae archaeon]MDK2913184.1 hypothetical protein [Thermococcaceae archaeon]
MKKRWKVLIPILLILVASSGCVIKIENKRDSGFTLLTEPRDVKLLTDWKAVNLELQETFLFPEENRSLRVTRNWTLILIKVGDEVANLSALPLGNSVYLIPPQKVVDGPKRGWKRAVLSVELKNGSSITLEVLWRGKATETIGAGLNFEAIKEGGSYTLVPIGVGKPTFWAFNQTYTLLILPEDVPSSQASNWEELLSLWANRKLQLPINNGRTDKRPIATIYIAANESLAFFDRVYFPYEELEKG